MKATTARIDIPRKIFQKAPRVADGERIYAIGDIHGRADLLVQMMRAISRDKKDAPPEQRSLSTKIIILGDFIDRGPQSRQLIEALQHFEQAHGLIVLLGNHEDALLACLDRRVDPRDGWLDFGGRETLESFGISVGLTDNSIKSALEELERALGRDTIEWLRALPLYSISGDFLFVHAGIRPGLDLRRQSPQDLLWIRDDFLSSQRSHPFFVVHGHSISSNVDLCSNRIGIDTGAWKTGRLTALRLFSDSLAAITVDDETSEAA